MKKYIVILILFLPLFSLAYYELIISKNKNNNISNYQLPATENRDFNENNSKKENIITENQNSLIQEAEVILEEPEITPEEKIEINPENPEEIEEPEIITEEPEVIPEETEEPEIITEEPEVIPEEIEEPEIITEEPEVIPEEENIEEIIIKNPENKKMIIPLYSYPGSNGELSEIWQKLVNYKKEYSDIDIIAIIPKEGLAVYSDQLREAGIIVIPYVWGAYSTESVEEIKEKIDNWYKTHEIDGIFLDGVWNKTKITGNIQKIDNKNIIGPEIKWNDQYKNYQIEINGENRKIISTNYYTQEIEIETKFNNIKIGDIFHLKPYISGEKKYATKDPINYYLEIKNYLKTKYNNPILILNTGVRVDQDFFDNNIADYIIIHESAEKPELENMINGYGDNWVDPKQLNYNKIGILIHSQNNFDENLFKNLLKYYNIHYITDDNMVDRNPWDTLSSYMRNMLELYKEFKK